MLTILPPQKYNLVKHFFHPLKYKLFPQAVLAGLQAGEIYCDDPTDPSLAMLITRGSWVYLAGDPSNESGIEAINGLIFNGGIFTEEAWGFMLSASPAWEPVLEKLTTPRDPVEMPRNHYLARKISFEWQSQIPPGYRLQRIDQSIQDRPDVPPDVSGLLAAWETIPDPAHQGFGFVAWQEDEIVAHAVVDVVVGGRGDMGLETHPDHRRKGLATSVSAAAIEYGLQHRGLTEILWDCGQTNWGSRKIAEKLGLDFVSEHTMYIVDFDPTWNLISFGLSNTNCALLSHEL